MQLKNPAKKNKLLRKKQKIELLNNNYKAHNCVFYIILTYNTGCNI